MELTPKKKYKVPHPTDAIQRATFLAENLDEIDTDLDTINSDVNLTPVTIQYYIWAADQAKTSTTTLASAASFTLEADSTYIFRAVLRVSAGTSTPGIKLSFTCTGHWIKWAAFGRHTSDASTVNRESWDLNNTDSSLIRSFKIVQLTVNPGYFDGELIYVTGSIVTSSFAPFLFDFQWAQNVSDANATAIRAGSFILVEKVGVFW